MKFTYSEENSSSRKQKYKKRSGIPAVSFTFIAAVLTIAALLTNATSAAASSSVTSFSVTSPTAASPTAVSSEAVSSEAVSAATASSAAISSGNTETVVYGNTHLGVEVSDII